MRDRREIPFDPSSEIFASAIDPIANMAMEFDSDTVASALRLPFETADPVASELIENETQDYIRLLETYGLEPELTNKLKTLLASKGEVNINGSSEAYDDVTSATSADGNTITAYISPRAVRNFVTDAMHAIRPFGDDEDIRFARDTGFRMAFTFGLTSALFDLGNSRLRALPDRDERLNELLTIGNEDLPALPSLDYEEFLPFRAAARFAIDRLRQLSSGHFSSEMDGQDVEEAYLDSRARALSSIAIGSYGKFSSLDLATAHPLNEDQAKQLIKVANKIFQSSPPAITIV